MNPKVIITIVFEESTTPGIDSYVAVGTFVGPSKEATRPGETWGIVSRQLDHKEIIKILSETFGG